MVSRFPLPQRQGLQLEQAQCPWPSLVLIPLGFVLVGSSPAEMLFGLFGAVRRFLVRRCGPGAGCVVGAPRGEASLKADPGDACPAASRTSKRSASTCTCVAWPASRPSPRRCRMSSWPTRPILGPARTSPAEVQGPAVAAGIEATLDWEPLRELVSACTRCDLHATRTQTVFGVGDQQARWMVIGEAPGADEDRQGEPFVGRAGQLLTSMLRAAGLRARTSTSPTCSSAGRPAIAIRSRAEAVAAAAATSSGRSSWSTRRLIVAVGRIAAQNLLATETPLARLRGTVHALGARARPVVVTYHPAYLLRSPGREAQGLAGPRCSPSGRSAQLAARRAGAAHECRQLVNESGAPRRATGEVPRHAAVGRAGGRGARACRLPVPVERRHLPRLPARRLPLPRGRTRGRHRRLRHRGDGRRRGAHPQPLRRRDGIAAAASAGRCCCCCSSARGRPAWPRCSSRCGPPIRSRSRCTSRSASSQVGLRRGYYQARRRPRGCPGPEAGAGRRGPAGPEVLTAPVRGGAPARIATLPANT